MPSVIVVYSDKHKRMYVCLVPVSSSIWHTLDSWNIRRINRPSDTGEDRTNQYFRITRSPSSYGTGWHFTLETSYSILTLYTSCAGFRIRCSDQPRSIDSVWLVIEKFKCSSGGGPFINCSDIDLRDWMWFTGC